MIGAMLLAAVLSNPGATVVPGAVAVIVAGQSNAEGRGHMLPEDLIPEPDVFVLKPNGRFYAGAEPFASTGKGVGFQRTLARGLVDAGYAPQVWIVQCAGGGSTLVSWTRGKAPIPLLATNGGRLYSNCMIEGAILERMGVPVVAVAWHQGESGCGNLTFEDQRSMLTELRDRFRADFPGVVFIAGEIADAATCARKEDLHAALREVADGVVESDGLTSGGVHFDRASQREFGRRYAEILLSLLPR